MKGKLLILIIVVLILVSVGFSYWLLQTMIKDEHQNDATADAVYSTTIATAADTVWTKNIH